MARLISFKPLWAKRMIRFLRDLILPLFYRGHDRFCPVCGKSSRRFRRYGHQGRADAQCVHCRSLERDRFLWLILTQQTGLLNLRSAHVLHIAPEACFEKKFRQHFGDGYLSADLENPDVMLRMDITNIPLNTGQFDLIFCGHVLEHVQNDAQALAEFHRILKPEGRAVVSVPLFGDVTFEDPTIEDPGERERLFGQPDHVRNYGLDFVDRAAAQGFDVTIIRPDGVADPSNMEKMKLNADEVVFFCCKRATPDHGSSAMRTV